MKDNKSDNLFNSENTDELMFRLNRAKSNLEYINNHLGDKQLIADAITQIEEERLEYMKKWNEMTDKERLEEGLKNSKLTKEVAERTSTKLINVKLREKGAKNGK